MGLSQEPAQIIGIQFSLLSPDEIRKGSVANITSRDTYINNRPVINGMFDPRMGTLEAGMVCPTDGHDHIHCPGYFGRVELARPVFYLHYLVNIIKILRCCCFKCSKLLISKEKYAHLQLLPPSERWNAIFAAASKVHRCGDHTDDGCGFNQPRKIRKEGLATVTAQWDEKNEDGEPLTANITPELCLRILSRISDGDVNFMGFSPVWSRPEWMICQVLGVPPPAVRPSVRHDAQQRSEDDLTHILVNILKTNKTLQDKIDSGAQGHIINDWTTLLQYYIATLVDNKMSGIASFAQRSGRPLKSIKDRMNGKTGRVRGNLMGKRVDYSARSVITPDPNLSISDIGVPMKIAMNLTYPAKVNSRTQAALTQMVRNGPNVYPGAKILARSTGEKIYLERVDRNSIELVNGDVVHRHMLDGDPVLFNRQPTLHRMSMMCHLARIMPKGDTFRMNVGDTKPYNADFDGDEMNMHMPQDPMSRAELLGLAAVRWQLISPANNKSIVGIFQDSLLGSFQLTRPNVKFSRRKAMNLLMGIKNVDPSMLESATISSMDLISQILPAISLRYKNKQFDESEDESISPNVLEIRNGNYIRGQLDKAALGDGTKGLIHRICNDFSNDASASFVDNIQDIVTKYMKVSAFSVGISDLIADSQTRDRITSLITDKKKSVKQLINETHLGIFDNTSGDSNQNELEKQINDLLGQALSQAGRVGLESLDKTNRFVTMVKAGSKGSDINLSQMISCLGQQQVDGKRVPYGFDARTLPHFTKYDDSPIARGFVENSFIGGLNAEEVFFHAMGGRVGLIDTAVKTSSTGYIQRRLVKGLEDLKIEYDLTVRNGKGKIIQFRYGDDGFDTVAVENQILPIMSKSLAELYGALVLPKDSESLKSYAHIFTNAAFRRLKSEGARLQELTEPIMETVIGSRSSLNKLVFMNKTNSRVHLPVAFKYLISNTVGQINLTRDSVVDITPLDLLKMVNSCLNSLKSMTNFEPTKLFVLTFRYYLSPVNLLIHHRFNKVAVELLLANVILRYKQSLAAPGEMVGIIAAQSIGEPTTQMTLNTFHFAGVASKSNVTRGVPRIEEILSLSDKTKNPSCTVYLPQIQQTNRENAVKTMHRLEHTKLSAVVKKASIIFDPLINTTQVPEDLDFVNRYMAFQSAVDECKGEVQDETPQSKWIVRLVLDPYKMIVRNITMEDVKFALDKAYPETVSCVYSDYNDSEMIFRIRLINKKKASSMLPLDQTDEIYLLRSFQSDILDNLVLRGVRDIQGVTPRKILAHVRLGENGPLEEDIWVVDTQGTNLAGLLSLEFVDSRRTFTNDIKETAAVLGIEAARQTIFNEISEVIEFDNTYINYHHLSLLVDRMTCNKKMVSIFRHGLNSDNVGPIAKASFEETPQMFMKAAQHGELDPVRGLSANVMCGQEGSYGTACFGTLLDTSKLNTLDLANNEEDDTEDDIDPIKPGCELRDISIPLDVGTLDGRDTGGLAPTYDPGF